MATGNRFSLLKINDEEDTLTPVPLKANSQKVPLEMEMDKENMNGRKPSGRYRYGGSRGFFNGGYLANGKVVIEGSCKIRIFDRRSSTGYKTGIKRSHANWGSPLDDIALACGKVYYKNEEYYDEFDYEAEIYIVHKDKSKSFGEIPAIN